MRADPDFSPSFGEIIDLRMSGIDISDGDGKTLAATLPQNHTRKAAIIAVGAEKEMALLYRARVIDRIQVEIFTDLGSAKKWVSSE